MPRQGPEDSATKYAVGVQKLGNDGEMWEIAETSAGVRRWKRIVSQKPAPTKLSYIGEWTHDIGDLIVTDPAYEKSYATKGLRLSGLVKNTVKGTWAGFASMTNDNRVAYLAVIHREADSKPRWVEAFGMGVDSGQAVIMQLSEYPDSDTKSSFYRELSKTTCRCKTLPKGMYSSTGYGDGYYKVYTAKRHDGKVFGVKIVFIDE